MAANFWTSSQSKQLLDWSIVSRLLHEEDDRMGLSGTDVRIVKMHIGDHLYPLANHLRLRQRVTATAIVYFRRVYATKSFADLDPRLVAPAALYVASKAEECTVQAKGIVMVMKSKPCSVCGYGSMGYEVRDVLGMEMRLLQALNFNLIVFHPYRPLNMYLEDVGRTVEMPKAAHQEMSNMAWAMVNDTLRTDLSLCHPPFLLAIAAIHLVAVMCRVDLNPWLEGLNIDMHTVRSISSSLLDFYDNFHALSEERVSAAVGRLPMRLP